MSINETFYYFSTNFYYFSTNKALIGAAILEAMNAGL